MRERTVNVPPAVTTPALLMDKAVDPDIAHDSTARACALQGYGRFKLDGRTEGLASLRPDLGRRSGEHGWRKAQALPDAA